MKTPVTFIDFLLREWLLIASASGLVLTSLHTRHLPAWSLREMQVLFILFVLFVSVRGLQQSGLTARIALALEKGRAIPLKLVMATFFLSMLATNDVTLLAVVPVTLSLDVGRKDILVILEALAANAGSALTPFGNPQNLFIYWFYGIPPGSFLESIAPFSLVFLALLLPCSLMIRTRSRIREDTTGHVAMSAWIHGLLFLVVLLTVLHLLPLASGILVILFALLFDRKALLIDYPLLLSFLFFFGIADNLKIMLAAEISHSGHIFLLSALASQVMSNVPATLLFAKFTSNWEALLWGVNAGGFGSLFGSLANLIAYKLYVSHEGTHDAARFTLLFLAMGYVALMISMGLYFALHPQHVYG